MAIEELETMVRVAWNRGTQLGFGDDEAAREDLRGLLGVYSDELQQLGDPRGELIALELLRTPSTDDRQRREALVEDWLGPLARHPNVNTRYGLVGVSVTDTDASVLQEALDSRGAPYLTSVVIFADLFTVRSTLATLAREVRPWLSTLRIVVHTTPPGRTFAMPVLSPDLLAGVIEATPALYSLALDGRYLARDFPHPTLRRLVVDDGDETLGALSGIGEPFPAVTELDVTLATAIDLSVTNLPALRRLDLARNERTPIYRVFRGLALARQLTHVRLPALRTQQDQDLLQAVLDEMPLLERLELASIYHRGPHGIRHKRATLVIPPPMPWIPRDQLPRAMVLRTADRSILVDVHELVTTMEVVYFRLPIDERPFWDTWWDDLASGGISVPGADLAHALDACGPALDDAVWREVADMLRGREDVVAITRSAPAPE